ncbi:hypothetical protein C8A05DRAFT_36273 [Staphylotrichum tortipilum]|uniref:Uncharacterized protein n=1 Tax=Staphylotrichum tortipilum TaxID=2831512 RepID=A0AAN6MH45_9PEZI|nr:hypothetical protein C8A05DRAFT_36273 [Staphylotrichum longicolle]
MPVTVKACHLCMTAVCDKLNSLGIPYTKNGKKVVVNISSPTTWAASSLAAMCWRKLEFSYHAAVRNGNTISCSNA